MHLPSMPCCQDSVSMCPGGAASAYIGGAIRVSRALTSRRRDTGARKPEVGQSSWPLGNANGFCHWYGSPTLGNDEQGAALATPQSGDRCLSLSDKQIWILSFLVTLRGCQYRV